MESTAPSKPLVTAEKVQPMTLTQRELEANYNELVSRFNELLDSYKLLYTVTRKSVQDLAEFLVSHEEP
jgi:phage-related protein